MVLWAVYSDLSKRPVRRRGTIVSRSINDLQHRILYECQNSSDQVPSACSPNQVTFLGIQETESVALGLEKSGERTTLRCIRINPFGNHRIFQKRRCMMRFSASVDRQWSSALPMFGDDRLNESEDIGGGVASREGNPKEVL